MHFSLCQQLCKGGKICPIDGNVFSLLEYEKLVLGCVCIGVCRKNRRKMQPDWGQSL